MTIIMTMIIITTAMSIEDRMRQHVILALGPDRLPLL